jgi:hypothetical protein
MLRLIGCVCAFAVVLPGPSVLAADLDFEQREFKTTWRQKGTGNRISFSRPRQLGVEFGGQFGEFNTLDATFSKCDPGRDGGANLCVSGRRFECAFLVTLSQSRVAYLDLRRAPRADRFCSAMQGEYVILLD